MEKLERTSSRLEMMEILASLFKKTDKSEIRKTIYLLQGSVAPPFRGIEIGLGEKMVISALAIATGYTKDFLEEQYKEIGEIGKLAEEFVAKKKQISLFQQELTVTKVYDIFYKIATLEGEGSQDLKLKYMAELLNNAIPKEARYLVRIPLGRLRLGIGDPTILEALSIAVKGTRDYRDMLERAYNLCSDLGLVAERLYEEGDVSGFKIMPGNPVRPALAERLSSPEEVIKKLGKCAAECKYDGMRLQIHKKGKDVWIFSRRLENLTYMFPDVVKVVSELNVDEIIFECEALSYNEDTGEFYPFQITMQRKRKYMVEKMSEMYPLKGFVFDIIYLNGEDLTPKPYIERRMKLEAVFSHGNMLVPSEMKIVSNASELEIFFNDAVSRGLEGIIAKDLSAPYIAGARKFAWIKLKRSYKSELSDTVDVVILGYFKGKGLRSKLGIGGILAGVYDDEADMFKTVAKVGSGLSEEEWIKLRNLLDDIQTDHRPARVESLIEPDVWVEPKYVITVMADEITRSPTHTCKQKNEELGYALRFPRIVSWIREDKRAEDANTVKEIIEMYELQKHVSLQESEIGD